MGRPIVGTVVGILAGCVGVSASIAIFYHHGGIATAPIAIAIASFCGIVIGFAPMSVLALIIGLPLHNLLVRTRRTSVKAYAATGAAVGLLFLAILRLLARSEAERHGNYSVFGWSLVAGGVFAAVGFRLVAGDQTANAGPTVTFDDPTGPSP